MLAFLFPPEERGRAYAFPISGSRIGTLIGIAVFGLFLEFVSWRLVFLTMLPIGLIVMWTSLPMLHRNAEAPARDSGQYRLCRRWTADTDGDGFSAQRHARPRGREDIHLK